MKRIRYVHGWKGWIQCVYGVDNGGSWKWVQPCGLREALKIRNNVQKDKKQDYKIYKLVEVKVSRRSPRGSGGSSLHSGGGR